jgi:hypothetical protein
MGSVRQLRLFIGTTALLIGAVGAGVVELSYQAVRRAVAWNADRSAAGVDTAS